MNAKKCKKFRRYTEIAAKAQPGKAYFGKPHTRFTKDVEPIKSMQIILQPTCKRALYKRLKAVYG